MKSVSGFRENTIVTRLFQLVEPAVLQKYEEEHKGRHFTILLLCLDGETKQFRDEHRLPQAVSTLHPVLAI